MARAIVWVGVVLLWAPPAWAQAPEVATPDPVTPTTPGEFEQSRALYEKGTRAYEHGDYEIALVRFQSALAAAPSAEIHFNIARCQERLGRWDLAAASYEQYLNGKPALNDATEIRERIADLRLRALEAKRLAAPAPTAAPAAPRSLRLPAVVMLVTTVALAGAATGAYLSEWSDYQTRRDACQGQCSPESLDALRSRVQVAEVTGGVIYALAGAALVTDIVLWVVDARQRKPERRAALRGHGLQVSF